MEIENKYLTPKEVSEKLKLGIKATYSLFKIKDFPCVKIGKKYIIEENELERYLRTYQGKTINLP